jgi:hypothetical protein
MYNDDGHSGSFVLSDDSPLIVNLPYLFEYTFNMDPLLEGLDVRFKLEAENEIGST